MPDTLITDNPVVEDTLSERESSSDEEEDLYTTFQHNK